ncbi:addiction module protein [Cyclobacterium sp. 1_MG-2023]|uniref:addiction module protein n=1 Tax=Cyclobacterium sp. 1_MG-2023 TaxID=3062681 RepID=UPI0026E1EB51|nr:addiction module protein [Cyclobacterium sp. 1_MG-2023]MDO6437931.1 addiction module protein [Cyclobacterium sp. 1_MG-2023]
MIRVDIQSIKVDLSHWLTELQDLSVLEQLQSMKAKQESSLKLNSEQTKEVDSRLEKYENGEMKFSPWEQVRERIKSGLV